MIFSDFTLTLYRFLSPPLFSVVKIESEGFSESFFFIRSTPVLFGRSHRDFEVSQGVSHLVNVNTRNLFCFSGLNPKGQSGLVAPR